MLTDLLDLEVEHARARQRSRAGDLHCYRFSLLMTLRPAWHAPQPRAHQLEPAASSLYLEVAAAVTTFIQAGRYFDTRSKRYADSGAALRAS
ncbi:hypothetical protein [Amycolatopsis camponoti]|nr:hypothetical protein [Amycolatopsis camponoti]